MNGSGTDIYAERMEQIAALKRSIEGYALLFAYGIGSTITSLVAVWFSGLSAWYLIPGAIAMILAVLGRNFEMNRLKELL